MFTLTTHPQVVEDIVECVPEKSVIGKQFRKEAKPIMEELVNLNPQGVRRLEEEIQNKGCVCMSVCLSVCSSSCLLLYPRRSYELSIDGNTYTLLPNMVSVKRYQKTVHGMLFHTSYQIRIENTMDRQWG